MAAILLEAVNFEVQAELIELAAGTTLHSDELIEGLTTRGVSLVRFDENECAA